ncbi:DUF3137 domain-containing protein [Roseivirga sp. BDSF3-8]|uniref:DUF3137 domain-containing protein n=1 Tax=Roseivirga sp. BDSF3-8 TaxID=3241598 RepID=UPI00353198C5
MEPKLQGELLQLYDDKLKGVFQSLETKRRKLYGYYTAIALTALAGLLPFIFFHAIYPFLFLILVAGPLLILLIVRLRQKMLAYRRDYKQGVVGAVVKATDPSWRYDPEGCLSEEEYLDSGLFPDTHTYYKGDDLITGRIEKTDFRCSEVYAASRAQTGEKVSDYAVFKGLLFHADFNKYFSGKTYVWPVLPGGNGGSGLPVFGARDKDTRVVKLEDPEFNKRFIVSSTDEAEARYLLTPDMMRAILRIPRLYAGRPVYLSFVNNRVYCAIRYTTNLFEPDYYYPHRGYDDVLLLHYMIELNAALVHELKLNTRIWSKQ